MPVKDYYRILGVSPSAGRDEIKRAYRLQAKRRHPDSRAGARVDPEARGAFGDIGEAYAILSDPERRWRYDRGRRERGVGASGAATLPRRISRFWFAGLGALTGILRGPFRQRVLCSECDDSGWLRFGQGAFAVHRPCPSCARHADLAEQQARRADQHP